MFALTIKACLSIWILLDMDFSKSPKVFLTIDSYICPSWFWLNPYFWGTLLHHSRELLWNKSEESKFQYLWKQQTKNENYILYLRTSGTAQACGKKRKRSIVTELPSEDTGDILPRCNCVFVSNCKLYLSEIAKSICLK